MHQEDHVTKGRWTVATALLVIAVLMWLWWLWYIARALLSPAVPVTWGIFSAFLALILIFLIPALALFFPYRDRLSPYRFHISMWLVVTGLFWVFAPLYQYLSINTNRDLVLWYMIPYAWEVPVMGYVFFAPVYHRFRKIHEAMRDIRRGRPADVAVLRKKIVMLPVFSAAYFALIALVSYGPIGSYQFRVFGGAPWPEVIKNIVTGTAMGILSGTIIFFVLNRILAPYLATLAPTRDAVPFPIGKKLAMLSTTLVALAFLVFVPVAYRSAQTLLGDQVLRRLILELEECAADYRMEAGVPPCVGTDFGGGSRVFMVNAFGRIISPHPEGYRDIAEEDFEPEVLSAIADAGDEPTGVTSYRRDTRYLAFMRIENQQSRTPQFLIAVLPEATLRPLFRPFFVNSASMGITFGIVFSILIILLTRGIAGPVQSLTAAVREVSARRRPQEIRIGTGDELDTLAVEFNAMARQLRNYEQGLERKIAARTVELAEVNKKLGEKNEVLERVIQDVKKFDEELVRLNKAKSEFISMASHQLRTPLTAIKWYSNILSHEGMKTLTPIQRRSFHQMADANQRMIDLVNALLNVSRLEVGTLAIEPKRIALAPFLRHLVGEVAPLADSRGVRVSAHQLPALTLSIDERLSGEAVLNYLTNAIRYTPKGGHVFLDMAVKGKYIVISVTDTGYGIPDKDKKFIFGKFYRASNVANKEPHGTGLGLYIVKSVIELMGGTVGFTSEEGKGSSFWLALPRVGVKARAGTRGLNPTKV